MSNGELDLTAWRNEMSGSARNIVQGRDFHNPVLNFFGVQPRPRLGVPAMLPSRRGPYTDRHAVHGRLDDLAVRGVTLVQLGGVAGVGKSTTAANYLAGRSGSYPGGVYYADLGGGRSGCGTSVAEALDGWLVASGVLPSEVPAGLAARTALFRQLTGEQPVAVLLDDPVSAAQVATLCPSAPGSLVLVTAHRELSGMRTAHGAHYVALPMLEPEHALELLTELVGKDRVAAEPAAFMQLAVFSEGHPLMLRVIAAELGREPWATAGVLAARLADVRERTATAGYLMAVGNEYSVDAALELSVDGLPDAARALLTALAANPGPEFGAELVAYLGGDARSAADLVAAGLVEPQQRSDSDGGAASSSPPSRWRMHGLVHDFARRLAGADADRFAAAEARIVDWYLRRTCMADRARSPRWHLGSVPPDEPGFDTSDAAAAWLEAERANLRAAVFAAFDAADHETVWQLCESLWGLYFWSNDFGDWIDTHLRGIESAARLGNRAAEARIRLQLGFASFNQADFGEAAAAFDAAVAPAEVSGVVKLLAATVESLGLAELRLGRPVEALAAFDRTLALLADDPESGPAAVGNAHRHRARALSALGRFDEAVAVLVDEAAPAYRADGRSRYNVARALVDLGETLTAAGRAGEAVGPLETAVAEFGRLRNALQGAEALTALADAHEALGEVASAGDALAAAVAVYEALGSLKAPEIRSRLAAFD